MRSGILKFIVILFLLSINAEAQQNLIWRIKGKVIHYRENEPLMGVNILLTELKTGTATDKEGNFGFNDIAPGNYTLRFSFVGHRTVTKEITVPSEEAEKMIIKLEDAVINIGDIVVTGNPLSLDPKEFTQSTLSLNPFELQIKNNSTVAEMLDFQPGISMRSNGTAAARPVIRGFSNNRVLILQNGLRLGDLSNTSDDHGVSEDAGTAERIEVLRGPASLLYGSNAIGGVINVITESIPNFVPRRVDGALNIAASSVNKELTGGLDIHYGIDRFAFHGNFFKRENSDYSDGFGNKVSNSGQKSRSYQMGFSFIPSLGIAGLSYNNFNNSYGIPLKPDAAEGPVKIDMKKEEIRLLLESTSINSLVNSFSLKAGYQDYHHREIIRSTGETGTSFGLNTFSGDLSFRHAPLSENIQGIFGFWGLVQNYTASGEEAFTPDAGYLSFAAYILEQIKVNKLNIQLGGRYEYSRIKIPQAAISDSLFPSDKKNFSTISGSIGFVYNITEIISVFSNIATAFRAPTIEELSSFSIHEATATFDIGDRNLKTENNYGVDLGLRLRKENHIVEASGYYNFISDYIFRNPDNLFYNPEAGFSSNETFNDTAGFPVFRYSQANAILYGAELKAQYEFTNHLTASIVFDYIRGYQTETDAHLPQIPPIRLSLEQRYSMDNFWVGLQVKLASEQNKTAESESATKGYGLIDVYGGFKVITGEFIHIFNFRADNLLDQPFKDHLSAIKDFAYMPGRNVSASYKFLF